ncbi:Ring finger domain protein [Mycena sanguinolenta]|uniref:Ring finger domain protein n=1 Tax=Mycena sanguinolenta TaxID=230812 RepID=A0A8H6Z5G3_9AGAR|nr:Ring finger domain protein [Mycena sanguinolenta]
MNRSKKHAGIPSTRTPISFHERSKSRSPSRNGSHSDPFTICTTPATHTIKRKRSFNFSVAAETNAASAVDDIDRGQRIKPKPASSQNRVEISGASSSRSKKERERTRVAPAPNVPSTDGQARRSLDKGKTKQVVEMGTSSSRPTTPVYTGSLAAAEFERMRKELETLKETLKKTVHDDKKQIKKQNKTIEELRTQLAAETLAREEKEKSLVAASSKSRKNEELLKAIESSLQCQICIDLFSKPNVLAPCGHVFCLECLQQWFRSAPGNDSDNDMDPEDREQYILDREKSCPYCRAQVVRRPVPVFMVKSVVTALRNATGQPVAAQDEEDADPWKGLFLPDDESSDSDEDLEGYGSSDGSQVEFSDHDSEDLDDLDRAEMALAVELSGFPEGLARFYASPSESEDGSPSESDGEEEEGGEEDGEEDGEDIEDLDADATYGMPRWEPPRHFVQFNDVSSSVWKMLRRGCTAQFIAIFDIRYRHDEGLIAHISSLDPSERYITRGRNRLFLGWNIHIDPSEDTELSVGFGAENAFMGRQIRDIWQHPERWMVTERHGYPGQGIMDARRLAPVEEDADMYDTSDSEAYSNGEEDL